MRTILILLTAINLTACTNLSGNVVPQKGPTMEQVYDSLSVKKSIKKEISTMNEKRMTENSFQQIPNPELKMYVYPHLSGNEEIPIPGYQTQFKAYTRDHYALPSEQE